MREYFLCEKDKEKRVAIVTFNRPEKKNMATLEDMLDFVPLLQQIEEDDDVKVLIMKGAGDCFGSGADAMLLGPDTAGFSLDPKAPYPPVRRRLIQERKRWQAHFAMQALYHFAKVSIAQVHGYCYGLHFQWATAADITIASEDALFGHPAFRYIGPTEPTLLDWVQIMGIKKAKELVFTGRPFSAKEMEQCGLVNKVVPKERLEAEVNEIASVVALMPIDHIVVGKHLFETLQKMCGLPASWDVIAMAHNLCTHVKFEPGDFNIMKERLTKGVRAAIRDRDLRYPPAYRFSYSTRKGKK